MPITHPELPPKVGYVEVEIDGRHTYRNVKTGVLTDDEMPEPPAEERLRADVDYIAAMTGVTL